MLWEVGKGRLVPAQWQRSILALFNRGHRGSPSPRRPGRHHNISVAVWPRVDSNAVLRRGQAVLFWWCRVSHRGGVSGGTCQVDDCGNAWMVLQSRNHDVRPKTKQMVGRAVPKPGSLLSKLMALARLNVRRWCSRSSELVRHASSFAAFQFHFSL